MAEAITSFLTDIGLYGVTELTPTHVVVLVIFAMLLECIADLVYALIRGVWK